MANIAKPKGSKDDSANVQFERGKTVVHLHGGDAKGWKTCTNISAEQFDKNFEVVSEDKTEGKE